MDWKAKSVLVTGGASFIGSHLVDALVERGAAVRVADNLSSGRKENIQTHIDTQRIDFMEIDLLDSNNTAAATRDMEVVFHMASDHGGRGYVDTHPLECSTNFVLDGLVFQHPARAGVEKLVFPSSGCVYPTAVQSDPNTELYLSEELVQPPHNADNIYGWAKLMGEMVLAAYCEAGRFKAAVLRYFTAYGSRCPESHAITAMIGRAFIDQSPFIVWGTGEQVRNWTHVSDIVAGTLLAAERIDDGTPINIGTMERTRVVDAVREILAYTGNDLRLEFNPSKPTGPYNRVCNLTRCRRLLDWTPQTSFKDGLHATIDWYFATHEVQRVRRELPKTLLERVRT